MELSQKGKKPIIHLFSIIGTFRKKEFWADLYPSQKFMQKANELVDKAEELAQLLNLTDKHFDKLLKDIHRDIFKVVIFHDEEIQEKSKRIRKMPVTLQKEHRDDLIEIALQNCKNCTRNTKQCNQRKLFKKIDVPVYDPDKTESKCEYWYKETLNG